MEEKIKSDIWSVLDEHHKIMHKHTMRELFENAPYRFEKFSVKFKDILFDYSKI